MVKMASKESSPPPPSFLGFAVHQSIKFSEILFLRQIHILLLRSTKIPRRFSILWKINIQIFIQKRQIDKIQ